MKVIGQAARIMINYLKIMLEKAVIELMVIAMEKSDTVSREEIIDLVKHPLEFLTCTIEQLKKELG